MISPLIVVPDLNLQRLVEIFHYASVVLFIIAWETGDFLWGNCECIFPGMEGIAVAGKIR